MNPSDRLLSPLAQVSLEGYAEEITVSAGSTARFMLSGSDSDANVRVLRLIHGDRNVQGPGFKTADALWSPTRRVELERQETDFGSFVEIPAAPVLSPSGSFTLALWVYPTMIHGGWHTIVAKGTTGDFGYAIYCGGHRLLAAAISYDGSNVDWCAGSDYLHPNQWQMVALVYSVERGVTRVWRLGSGEDARRRSHPASSDVLTELQVRKAPLHESRSPLLIAASAGGMNGRHWGHFNGKVARPILIGSPLTNSELVQLAGGLDPSDLGPVLGQWDFSRRVTGDHVEDVSIYGNHGRAINAPSRAVTGPSWSGSPSALYTENPTVYDAIHFHEDDLDDARWKPTVEIQVPVDARSSIYSMVVETSSDSLHIPFVVTPAVARADIALLVPTLTWQAYGTNRFPWSYSEDGALDRGVSLYEPHSDGSMVYYTTRRKSTRAWDPSKGIRLWGAHLVAASLYLVDWLEEMDFPFDTLTDESLHHEGSQLLNQYRCVVLGSHPEYWTSAMLDALREYTHMGGRVLYLGGNGLYWVTSIDSERPFLMEVRKSGEGDYDERWIKPEPGQYQHNTTLEVGGLWARRGRPPREIVGVEHAANVFTRTDGGWGFRRLPPSYHDRFSFIFEGVTDDTIGNFGLNLGTAAAYEMDRAQEGLALCGDAELIVLARASHKNIVPPTRMPVAPAADLTLLLLPNGGAVFAAGSITWTGSLSWDRYNNNVSAVTRNVLDRFLEASPGDPIA